VHVNRGEARPVEGSGHFRLAVNALLAQDRDLRPDATLDVGRSDVVIDIEAQGNAQTRIVLFEQRVEFLVSAIGIVAKTLDAIAGLGPLTLQQTAVAAYQALELRDYGRVDMRLQPDGHVHVIEVNPNPWLSSKAEFAMAARKSGRNYPQLVEEIVELAMARA